jgi:hypothetical protein
MGVDSNRLGPELRVMELFDLLFRLVDFLAWALYAAGEAAEISAAGAKGARWIRSRKPLPPMPDPEALLETARKKWQDESRLQPSVGRPQCQTDGRS